jgi:putative ABC transport system ATP-binding protein
MIKIKKSTGSAMPSHAPTLDGIARTPFTAPRGAEMPVTLSSDLENLIGRSRDADGSPRADESAERSAYVVETRNLRKEYGSDGVIVPALRGVDLRVRKGEFLAIMGRSGSGKSTLLHILGGVEVPTSGQVLLEDRDLATMDDDRRTLIRRTRMGFIFQSFNLLPAFTAEENVALPMELCGASAQEARRRAVEMLELVGVAHRLKHVPSNLSGGEQQRVAIARALVVEPALLLADEPTGNLDSVNGQQVTTLLRRLVDERQHTIVMVTHDPVVASQADRLVRLRDGLIDGEGPQSAESPFPVRSCLFTRKP